MPIPVATLVDHAAELFGIPSNVIKSKSRTREHVLPRWAVCVAADASGRGPTAIGRGLKRNHATVGHGIKQGNYHYQRDWVFRDRVDRLVAAANEWKRLHGVKQGD